ncbi:MAG TPA: DNA mismatch repair endonuclease MutL [Chloroflexota bacterium]|jgi:DNA mismatch repair protein MutL|nr:DNA mismatch repair endonuclease MutL [Chloroflexota bacterium]
MRSAAPPDASRIRLLDAQLAARIAAGEVIERPASVVKELLENTLDAGATSVRVEIEDGGMTAIRVVDNGSGIVAEEIDLAFTRHATSKIRSLDDLQAIATLGFRGEALPSIAAVADVTIRTRHAGAAAGVRALLRDGRVVERLAVGLPSGTAIEVVDLFAGLPARRKFLKGRQAETSAVSQVVAQYAIAYPRVDITLVIDGQRQFTTAGARHLRDVLACLWGVEAVDGLLDVFGERHGIRVRGLASRVGHTRATRAQQSFFVNGRWVRNRVLSVALEEAYHSMLMGGRHPVGVLFLDVPPGDLDVNVHPAKTEVRFLREREVFGAIRHAVQSAIGEAMAIVGTDSAPAEQPESPVEQLALLDIPASSSAQEAAIAPPARALPVLRVLGQANALFIIAEGVEGVYMVDQHAAHERVLYDELCVQVQARSVAVQQLLEPALVEVSAPQMEALSQCADLLRDLGFDIEPFGATTCLLRAVPALLASRSASEILAALLDDLAAGKEHGERQERSLATMACKAAVKAGQTLSMEEMRSLVQRLEMTSRPRTCPHGRPTMILLSTSALERQFGRR